LASWRFTFPRRAAFTLAELLAVVAIMAILLATVVPSISGLARSAGLRGATMQVRTALAQARQTAITRRVPTGVLFPTWQNDMNKGFRAIIVASVTGQYTIAGGPAPNVYRAVGEWQFLPPGVVIDAWQVWVVTNVHLQSFGLQGGFTPFYSFQQRGGGQGTIHSVLGTFGTHHGFINLYEGWVDGNGVRQARPNGATNQIEIKYGTGAIKSKRLGE
jgi:prepilin-type N-terminal cleavage/methylation domain-containing protein